VLQVVIYCDDGGISGEPDAAEQGIMLPEVAHQVDAPDVRPCRRTSREDLPAFIPTSIIYQDDFMGSSKGGKDGAKFSAEGRQ